jgi:hypothetical protein
MVTVSVPSRRIQWQKYVTSDFGYESAGCAGAGSNPRKAWKHF